MITYQDPNSPAEATGYNVYRSSVPTGSWTLVGPNVADMDGAMPDIQYVDPTGDVGGPWYYQLAAWNSCGAEGPW